MALLCSCPLGVALPNLPKTTCPAGIGQIQKIIFQRLYDSDTNALITTGGDPSKKATWTALLAAADDTKVIVSPVLYQPEHKPGDKRTWGGGNTTPGGVEMNVGSNPSSFTGRFIEQDQQTTMAAIKALECETIGVYLIDENGKIACISSGTLDPITYYPIPLATRSLFVGEVKFGGYEEPDGNDISWDFKPNTLFDLAVVVPSDFDALKDL
jgi:hypothetical protein